MVHQTQTTSINPDANIAFSVLHCWRNGCFTICLLSLVTIITILGTVDSGYLESEILKQHNSAITPTVPKAPDTQSVLLQEDPPFTPRSTSYVVHMIAKAALPVTYTILCATILLYALIHFFTLQLSISNRLGGITQGCRGLIYTLLLLIYILPWHIHFSPATLHFYHTFDHIIAHISSSVTPDKVSFITLYIYWGIASILLIKCHYHMLASKSANVRKTFAQTSCALNNATDSYTTKKTKPLSPIKIEDSQANDTIPLIDTQDSANVQDECASVNLDEQPSQNTTPPKEA